MMARYVVMSREQYVTMQIASLDSKLSADASSGQILHVIQTMSQNFATESLRGHRVGFVVSLQSLFVYDFTDGVILARTTLTPV